MPLAAGVTTLLQTFVDKTLGVYIGGRNLNAYVKWNRFMVQDGGTNARGQLSMHLANVTLAALPEIRDRAKIDVIDFMEPDRIFTGYVVNRRSVRIPGYDGVDIVGTENSILIDEIFIPYERRPAETLQARIGYLWGKYAGQQLNHDLQHVASFGGTLPVQEFVSVTLREAIELVHAQASSLGDDYVDQLGRLHVYRTAPSNPAPFDIDADAPGAGEIAPHDLVIDWDARDYANRVYVQGANRAGSGFFNDPVAIDLAGGAIFTASIPAPDCTTATMALRLAERYLGLVASGKPRGSFTTTSPNDGWRAGQFIDVTSAADGLSADEFRIHRVTTTIAVPAVPPTHPKRRYRVEFGGVKVGGVIVE